MKKQEKGPPAAKPGPPPSSPPSTMGMKHSKSDHSGMGGQSSGKKSSLGKVYLSKSHENLSSHQKKKLSTVVEQPGISKPKTGSKLSDSSKSVDKNKENVALKEKEKNSSSMRAKPNKPMSLPTTSTIRKSSSTQSIDKTSTVSAGSGSTKSQPCSVSNKTQTSIKRAQSTQNVSKDKLTRKRISAPTDVMAYNAELLANFEKDKKLQEARISELIQKAEGRKAEIEKLKYENKRLKDQIPTIDVKEEIDFLRNRNKTLLDRLHEQGVTVEQITDTEKLSMLRNGSGQSGKNNKSGEATPDSNIPNSASCDSLSTDGAKGPSLSYGVKSIERSTSVCASELGLSLGDLCCTPDHPSVLSLDQSNWDKQSNKSGQSDGLSEISVACLTERIILMEENNYSTTEELQATLQELGDLQDAVNELTEENERLADEKSVLLESLCTQTQKLENTRIQVEQLKCLLINGSLPGCSKREELLIVSLKNAQDEREELIMKLTEHSNALHATDNEFREVCDINEALRDKSSLLEDKIVGIKSDKDLLEQQAAEMREVTSSDKIEINRLKTLLENEKTKVAELELFHKATDKTDLETLLDNARQEKDKTEEKLANVEESLAHSQCEVNKLKELLLTRDEEIKVIKNNAKTQVSDLEYKALTLEKGRTDLQQEVDALRDHIDQLEQDCNRYQETEKYQGNAMQEIQKELSEIKQKYDVVLLELNETRNVHATDEEEWKQFQKDLQVAVVIANDLKSETQDTMEEVRNQNACLKDKVRKLEGTVDKLKQELDLATIQKYAADSKTSILTNAELKGKVICSVDRELAALRDVRRIDPKTKSLSVKSLINSIETQVKSGCSSIHSSHNGSRRNSDSADSTFSLQDILQSPTSPARDSPLSPQCETTLKSVLKKPNDKPTQRHTFVDLHRSPGDQPKSMPPFVRSDSDHSKISPTITSILHNRQDRNTPRRNSGTTYAEPDKKDTKDPLSYLAKQMGGSKRNALLKWCQQKTVTYTGVDITNFSSSWNDGLAFCSILHCYLPHKIPYNDLNAEDKRRNFMLAFNAGEEEGIPKTLCINDMVAMERPDWQAVMCYVTSVYKHFEIDLK